MLSKTGIHAVRALLTLARLPEGSFMGAAAIAKEIDAPQNYLGKLLQLMSREGLVFSQRGLGGGFCLARHPKDIALIDVVGPIEHLGRWSTCILGQKTCSDLTHLVCPFAPWRRRSSITELRLCAFVVPCQETKLLNQLTNLFLAGS